MSFVLSPLNLQEEVVTRWGDIFDGVWWVSGCIIRIVKRLCVGFWWAAVNVCLWLDFGCLYMGVGTRLEDGDG